MLMVGVLVCCGICSCGGTSTWSGDLIAWACLQFCHLVGPCHWLVRKGNGTRVAVAISSTEA